MWCRGAFDLASVEVTKRRMHVVSWNTARRGHKPLSTTSCSLTFANRSLPRFPLQENIDINCFLVHIAKPLLIACPEPSRRFITAETIVTKRKGRAVIHLILHIVATPSTRGALPLYLRVIHYSPRPAHKSFFSNAVDGASGAV